MSREMSVSEARGSLPEIIELIAGGGEVTLTRHGRPVAVVVRPDRLRSRRADAALEEAAGIGELLRTARRNPMRPTPALTQRQGAALLAEVDAGRRGR